MQLGIVGHGFVGKHLEQMFVSSGQRVIVFDKYDPKLCGRSVQSKINDCDLVFVAVPTPGKEDGACDTSAVEEVVAWVQPPMCLKSTVVPGTTDRLIRTYNKQLVFSPEYVGETPFHNSKHSFLPDLVALGGDRSVCEAFLKAHQLVLGPQPRYFVTDAVTAELAKYMENCFFATKVSFVAQFYLLAAHFGADFAEMREIWLADSRVGRSHSAVVDQLGFSGRCLPKDLAAIITEAVRSGGDASFLEGVQKFNSELRRK
ncbi:MAG: hypothetical protein M3O31_11895 [Acidobacteriota bacterium]|nr:hypothetical protein [Acidobacteriota bacterium]